MIIVLPGADFSANNLGQVEVTVHLDPFTEAAIAASGNTSLSNVQKSALNTFFKKIGAFGEESAIWGKLQKVYLPILAGAVGKAVYNYKAGVYDGEPTDTSWQLRNHGLVGKLSSMPTSGSDALDKTNVTDFIPVITNYSFFEMVMETPVSGIVSNGIYLQGDDSMRFSHGVSLAGTGAANLTLTAISPSGSIANGVATLAANVVKKLVGVTIRSSSDLEWMHADGTKETTTKALVNSFGTNNTKLSHYTPFSQSNGAGIVTEGASIGVVMVGQALTSSEMSTLKEAVDTLAVELTAA